MEETVPENLLTSLFILRKCRQGVVRAYETFAQHQPEIRVSRERHFAYDMAFYLILESDNFLEEYNNHFTPVKVEPEYKERLLQIKEICKPVMKQIKRWKDLHRFRNNIIAHGWRDKTNNYKFAVPDLHDYKVPRNQVEFLMLSYLIGYIFSLIQAEFQVEMKSSFVHVANQYKGELPPEDYSNVNYDLTNMVDEVWDLCNKHDKPYRLQIRLFEFPNHNPLSTETPPE